MSHADDVFMRQFGVVLGLLVIFAIVVYFIASAVGMDSHAKVMNSPSAVAERIAPVGSVETGEGEAVAAVSAPGPVPVAAAVAAAEEKVSDAVKTEAVTGTAPPPATELDGQQIYQTACFACHATGAANSPKLTDKAEWQKRAEQGFDTMLHNALKGKNAMPAKGGRADLSDEAVRAAVNYMLEEAGVGAG